jgi:hypothetical protein
MAAETDPDTSHKIRCPTCGATEARTLIRSAPIAYVRCGACGMVWSVLDRRGTDPSRQPLRDPCGWARSADGNSAGRDVLWRVGAFVCVLRSVSDLAFPAVLCVEKDGEPVLEVPVISALEVEERADDLRLVVERHRPRDSQ